jgi:cellulose synthase/poly-beta-1,6-N-acetylglucosamine synthase-like glycosyltransferase
LLEWIVFAGIVAVCVVLVELARLNLLLMSNLENEQKLTELNGARFGDSCSLVSVIIPAKDEGESLELAVQAVLASDYGNLEIILANDRSMDNTLEVMERLSAQDCRIQIVSIRELPPGWTGKTHALYQGAKRSSGDVLLFTDADTILHPAAIPRAIHHLHVHKLDMLSLLPQFRERRFNENAIYPHLALGFSYMYPLSDVNDPSKEAALASGCFILIGKHAYERVGTWSRFRTEITEDVALSKAVKARGLKFNVVRGGHLVCTKPFERLSDVQRFWKRTFYGGLERSVPKILRLTMNYLALTMVFAAFLFTLISVMVGKTSAPIVAFLALSAITIGAVVIPYGLVVKEEGGSWLYSLTAPVGIGISAWIAASALVAAVWGRGVVWRGSVYR